MSVSSPRPLILILEDDAVAAAALAMLLDDWGYETIQSMGLRGLELAIGSRRADVSAIITDYHLNGCTGPEAVAGLRALGVGGKVLMMTGTLKGKARAEAHAAGHEFLEKPATAVDILDWLKRAVGPGNRDRSE